MSPRRYFSDMMKSPNFRNETYKKNGKEMENKIKKILKKIKGFFNAKK